MDRLQKLTTLWSNKFKQVKVNVWLDKLTGKKYLDTDTAYQALLNKLKNGGK